MVNVESDFLKSWKLKLGILMAVIVPSISVTAGVYNLKSDIEDRITQVQIDSTDNYVRRDEFKELRNDVKELRNEINELKLLILRRTR